MKLGNVPITAPCFYQLDAGRDLLLSVGQCGFLGGQEGGLGSDDIEVWIDAGTIANIGFSKSSFCRFDRRVLLLDHLRQNSHGGEVVLYLLECGQHGLPIVGDGYLVPGLSLLHRRTARSAIENGLGEARPD
jgi:hypothetical protein